MLHKKRLYILLGLLTAFLCLNAMGQEQKQEKISVEIVTENNGKKEVFKKTYNSMEEMNADPEYQKLNGNSQKSISWSSTNDDAKRDRYRFMFDGNDAESDSTKKNVQVIISDDGEDFYWHPRNGKNRNWSFAGMNFEELEDLPERIIMKMERWKNDTVLAKRIEDGFKNFEKSVEISRFNSRDDFEKSRENRKGSGDMRRHVLYTESSISISDLDPTKDANFIKNNKLNLEKSAAIKDLTLSSTRGTDRYMVEFEIEKESPMSVKLTAANTNVVYLESVSAFKGKFIRTIDLSDQDGKEYFLEISTGKDKTVKRLIID
jgi:hypothetical protein